MANIIDNLKQIWQQATFMHRFLLISIVMGFGLVAVMLATWASQPDMGLLYGGLSTQDAASIADKLTEEGIKYELRDGGTAILVPNDKIYSLRLTMAKENLVQGGDEGWKILDQEGLGISPFKEGVNYVRALCGELSKTIRMIEGVQEARVQIVSERRSVLSRARQDAKASVFVKTGGNSLSKANVQAIANLVAGAAKGVTAEKVVVVVNGKLEAGRERDEISALNGTLFEQKVKMEKYLAGKAEEQLAMVVGMGKCSVKVNATLSSSSISRTTRKLDASGRVETHTTTKKKDEKGLGRGNSSAGSSKKDTTEEVTYDTPSTTEVHSDGPGKLEKVTASVFVDLSGLAGKTGEGAAPAPKLTIQDVKKIVQKALGLETDTDIEVRETTFVTQTNLEPQIEEASMFSMDNIFVMLKKSSLGIAIMGMLVALKIMSGKKAGGKKSKGKKASEETEAEDTEGEPAAAAPQSAKMQVKQLKGADRALRQQIVNSLTANPDEVKQMFMSWIESTAE